MVDDLADQREADDPLREGTNVDVGQGRREEGAPSEPPVPDSWCSPVTLASKSAGRHRRVRRVNRSTGRQAERAAGLLGRCGLTSGSIDAWVRRHDEISSPDPHLVWFLARESPHRWRRPVSPRLRPGGRRPMSMPRRRSLAAKSPNQSCHTSGICGLSGHYRGRCNTCGLVWGLLGAASLGVVGLICKASTLVPQPQRNGF